MAGDRPWWARLDGMPQFDERLRVWQEHHRALAAVLYGAVPLCLWTPLEWLASRDLALSAGGGLVLGVGNAAMFYWLRPWRIRRRRERDLDREAGEPFDSERGRTV